MQNNNSLYSPRSILTKALYIILRPNDYFRNMPKGAPLSEPLIFAFVIGIITTFIVGVIGFLQGSIRTSDIIPILAVSSITVVMQIFFTSAILFLIWRLMKSPENYNTAFWCLSACMAITPITSILNLVPYFGWMVAIVWQCHLLIVASVQVHGINVRKATVILATFSAFILGIGLYAQKWLDSIPTQLESMGFSSEQIQEMTPNERLQILLQQSYPPSEQTSNLD